MPRVSGKIYCAVSVLRGCDARALVGSQATSSSPASDSRVRPAKSGHLKIQSRIVAERRPLLRAPVCIRPAHCLEVLYTRTVDRYCIADTAR